MECVPILHIDKVVNSAKMKAWPYSDFVAAVVSIAWLSRDGFGVGPFPLAVSYCQGKLQLQELGSRTEGSGRRSAGCPRSLCARSKGFPMRHLTPDGDSVCT
jgi:hypothetical protein